MLPLRSAFGVAMLLRVRKLISNQISGYIFWLNWCILVKKLIYVSIYGGRLDSVPQLLQIATIITSATTNLGIM